MTETTIDLIRHGEPEGGRRYRGRRVDDPLSELGWRQMWEAVGEHAPWTEIVSSPLRRCREFAAALGEQHRIGVYQEDDFREIGLGWWEGLRRDEVRATDPEGYHAFYHAPHRHPPQGGEPLLAFQERVASAYQRTVERFPGRHLLVVAHAGVIRAVIGHTLGAQTPSWYRIHVAYAGITRIHHGDYGPSLVFHHGRLGL